MTNEDGIPTEEFSTITYEHLNHYIKLADQKASILLTAQLAYLAIFSGMLNDSWRPEDLAFQGLAVASILISLAAAFFAARTVYPDTPSTSQGLILWKSIVEKGEEGYKQEIAENNPNDFLNELLDENYQLASVANGKYDDLRNSLWATAAMVVLSMIVGAYLVYC